MRLTLIAAMAAALALPPAFAADADGSNAKAETARAAQEAERNKADKASAERPADDLVTCKRDADGMRGPKRSRFMTECLKERR